MSSNVYRHTLVSIILEEWGNHQALGVREVLQVQELLKRIPDDLPIEQLRNFLASLLVTNDIDQILFYRIFQESQEKVNLLREKIVALSNDISEKPLVEKNVKRIILSYIGASVAFVLAGLCTLLLLTPTIDKPKSHLITKNGEAQLGDTIYTKIISDSILLVESPSFQINKGKQIFIDSSGTARYIANDSLEITDSVVILIDYRHKVDTFLWVLEVTAPYDFSDLFSDEAIEPTLIPFPENLSALKVDKKEEYRLAWIKKNEWLLKFGVIFFVLFALWVIEKIKRLNKERVIARITQANKAPYVWSPQIKNRTSDWLLETAVPLLNRFRGRTPDTSQILDIRKSILATSRKAGRVEFRYKQKTLPPDYLLLLDRYTVDDHQARLYDELYHEMLRAEVEVTRYFYQGDPRLCFNEQFPSGVSLLELEHRHTNTQLIIVGNGASFLSPVHGKPAKWTQLLSRWKKRVLLSPKPFQEWSHNERELSKLLLVLPASPQGLALSVQAFQATVAPTQKELIEQINDATTNKIHLNGNLIKGLEESYGKPLLYWIAACSLWPELKWDLTLHFGQEIENITGEKIVTFDNLRKLFNLPWFKQGKVPERARKILVEYLEEIQLDKPLRNSLKELLVGLSIPPVDSVAYVEYRMNIILNELMLKPSRSERKRLEAEFSSFIQAGNKPDFVALYLLDRAAKSNEVVLSKKLKKFAFKQGLSGLGWRFNPLSLIASILTIGFILAYTPDYALCDGDIVTFAEESYCITSSEDYIQFYSVLAADAIEVKNHQKVDSLRLLVDSITDTAITGVRDSSFYLNTITRYTNSAITIYNCIINVGENCSLSKGIEGWKNESCFNLSIAKDLMDSFSEDLFLTQLSYTYLQQTLCEEPPTSEQTDVGISSDVSELQGVPEEFTIPVIPQVDVGLIVKTMKLLDSEPLNGVTVYLFEYTADEGEVLIDSVTQASSNEYFFLVQTKKRYVIRGEKNVYGPAVTSLDLKNISEIPDSNSAFLKELYLGQSLEFFAFDADTELPLPGAEVRLIDPETVEVMGNKINPEGNDFRFSISLDHPYQVEVSRKGYKPVMDVISFSPVDLDAGGGKISFDVYLQPYDDPNLMLPLYLYFEYGKPNRSLDSMPEYVSLNVEYYKLKQDHIQNFTADMELEEAFRTRRSINDFFNLEVRGGRYDLEEFSKRLLVWLEGGFDFTMDLKGFTCPRGEAQDNLILSERRISAVLKFFEEYKDGALIPYIDNNQLSFETTSLGESQADPRVSDDITDPKNSIFNLFSRLEDRVEVRSINR